MTAAYAVEGTVSGVPHPVQRAFESLPILVERASATLRAAHNSAEVLEARDFASATYDLAKRTGRLLKAKEAHDDLLEAARRAQGDALLIEQAAQARLYDEYEAAKAADEVAVQGRPKNLPDGKVIPKAADLGLTHKQVHEARQTRVAEAVDPGLVRRTVEQRLASGQEPTKASVRAAVRDIVAPEKPAWTSADIADASSAEPGDEASSSSGISEAWKRLTAPIPKPAPYIQGDTEVVHAIRQVKELIGPLGGPKAAMRRFPPQLAHSVTSDELFDLGRWFLCAAKEWQEIEGGSRVAAE